MVGIKAENMDLYASIFRKLQPIKLIKKICLK